VRAWCSFSSYMCRHSCTELPFWIRHRVVWCSGACVLLIFIMHVRHSRTKLPLWIRRGALRCSGACVVLIFSFPGCPWLPLAVPGCSWAAPGCSWAAPGCSWLLLAASGCSWLPLAVIHVNSRYKENNLFGVLHWHHISTLALVLIPVLVLALVTALVLMLVLVLVLVLVPVLVLSLPVLVQIIRIERRCCVSNADLSF
jgi:hypothetical protein